ncbi:hypothetical protein K8T06_13345, partial [bacterium]|nr:hypothetical protein [bacterium]
ILTEPLDAVPDDLNERFPEVSFQLQEKGILLSVIFNDGNSPAAMNRMLIPELFKLGIDIEEIRKGSDLEKVYLEDRLNNH